MAANVVSCAFVSCSVACPNRLSFKQAIGEWATSNVRKMSYMFNGAVSFNQAIGEWDTRRLAGL